MNDTISDNTIVVATPKTPAADLRHRRHTLNPNRTWLDRCGIAIQSGMEWAVTRVSPLGDPHIYDTRQFPWVAGIEAEWQAVRKELDAVMTFRDQMPSFQDILKEVGAIQSDNNWKTFFLAGIGMDCGENRKRCPETVRLLGKSSGVSVKELYALFPKAPAKTAARIAGIPKPRGCI